MTSYIDTTIVTSNERRLINAVINAHRKHEQDHSLRLPESIGISAYAMEDVIAEIAKLHGLTPTHVIAILEVSGAY